MLRLSEQILLLIGWGKELFPDLGELADDAYNYGRLLVKHDRAVRRALTRLVARGEVIKKGKRAKARYQITGRGKARIMELRPYVAKRTWDRKWRIVVFDIPEKYRGMRAVLRRFLKSMGLVNFQRSLWLTPFDVSREVGIFLKACQLGGMAFLMEVEQVRGIEVKELAVRGWQLEILGEKYKDLAKRCREASGINQQLRRQWVKLVFEDPLLPRELEPKDFPREKAVREYKDLIVRSS